MTYRQKYAEDNPVRAEVVHHYECPGINKPRCPKIGMLCKDCWDREIEEPDLPACPFCGSTNLTEDMDSKGWFIACKGCLTEGPRGETREEAESRWNRRS